jgi:hypothetical protein
MVKVGDRVRSFDFDYCRDLTGERACYVEGYVVGIQPHGGCDRYVIEVDRVVFRGEERHDSWNKTAYPPVNGTPKLMGGIYNAVEAIR